ncbi:MAG: hypothetical protein HYT77_01700 [Deltaproteobacteria bacterium]|nr:hypothetical protein [Deltaproteobacteria bacterium]
MRMIKIALLLISFVGLLGFSSHAGPIKLPDKQKVESLKKSEKKWVKPKKNEFHFVNFFSEVPLWEKEWAKIREDVLNRFYTDCMVKFADDPACKSDPIKQDVVLKYGRAINRGNYEEAMRQYAAWVSYEPLISLNTARVYDLALSALAKAVITKGNVDESKEGLKAVLNLGIATCDVLLPTQKGCLFQRMVKNNWSFFVAAVRDYPNKDIGLACVDFEQNEVRRYKSGCREKPGEKGKKVCVSAMAGYLNTYKNPELQGPVWGCSSCEMVENDFFCGKGLPPCLEAAAGPEGTAGMMRQGSSISGENKTTPFQGLTGQGPNISQGIEGIVGNAENPMTQCNPSKSLGSGMKGGGGFSIPAACFALKRGDVRSDKVLQCGYAFASTKKWIRLPKTGSPWKVTRDPGCQYSQSARISTADAIKAKCAQLTRLCSITEELTDQERTQLSTITHNAVDLIRDNLDLFNKACSAAQTNACAGTDWGLLAEAIGETLISDPLAVQMSTIETGKFAFAPAVDPQGMGELTNAAIVVTPYMFQSRDQLKAQGIGNSPSGSLAHEIGHIMLAQMGVPTTLMEGSKSIHHISLDELSCRAPDDESAGCQNAESSKAKDTKKEDPCQDTSEYGPDTRECCEKKGDCQPDDKKDGTKKDCDPDSTDCGCSALNTAQQQLLDCTSEEEVHPRDPIGPVFRPHEEGGGDPLLPDYSSCARELVGEERSVPNLYRFSFGPGVIDCIDDPTDPCKCYGCGAGGSTLTPATLCGNVTCLEGSSCNPATGRCESGDGGGGGPRTPGEGPMRRPLN